MAALRKRASWEMRRQPPDHTLQTTALVNEVYLRVLARQDLPWRDVGHLWAMLARAMRQVLVDHWRKRNAGKRSAGGERVPLDHVAVATEEDDGEIDVERDHLGVQALAEVDAVAAQIVELRYFRRFTMRDTTRALGMKPRTAERKWTFAKAWLHGWYVDHNQMLLGTGDNPDDDPQPGSA